MIYEHSTCQFLCLFRVPCIYMCVIVCITAQIMRCTIHLTSTQFLFYKFFPLMITSRSGDYIKNKSEILHTYEARKSSTSRFLFLSLLFLEPTAQLQKSLFALFLRRSNVARPYDLECLRRCVRCTGNGVDVLGRKPRHVAHRPFRFRRAICGEVCRRIRQSVGENEKVPAVVLLFLILLLLLLLLF